MREPFERNPLPPMYSARKELKELLERCQHPGEPITGINTENLLKQSENEGKQIGSNFMAHRDEATGDVNALLFGLDDPTTYNFKIGNNGLLRQFESGPTDFEGKIYEILDFEYDDRNRLVKRYWYKISRESTGDVVAEEGLADDTYVYPAGRPDEEYTHLVRLLRQSGQTKTLERTFEDRQLADALGQILLSMDSFSNQEPFPLSAIRALAENAGVGLAVQTDEQSGKTIITFSDDWDDFSYLYCGSEFVLDTHGFVTAFKRDTIIPLQKQVFGYTRNHQRVITERREYRTDHLGNIVPESMDVITREEFTRLKQAKTELMRIQRAPYN